MARFLIILGAALVVLGFAWPLLAKLGLGHLPGDILIERENFTLFVPLTSGLIVSGLLPSKVRPRTETSVLPNETVAPATLVFATPAMSRSLPENDETFV